MIVQSVILGRPNEQVVARSLCHVGSEVQEQESHDAGESECGDTTPRKCVARSTQDIIRAESDRAVQELALSRVPAYPSSRTMRRTAKRPAERMTSSQTIPNVGWSRREMKMP